ncbi:hypothetical protein [Rosistilla oblonga]|uniref:hypothetical protein n=1 Tax=Rosistilla oblonga TaxID=2527990 RepID=UPI003A97717C
MSIILPPGSTLYKDDLKLKTPAAVQSAYESGLAGYYTDEEQDDILQSSMDYQNFGEVLNDYARRGISETDEESDGLHLGPLIAVLRCHAQELGITGTDEQLSADDRIAPYDEAQTTGDCTSHWLRNHIDQARASEIQFGREAEGWHTRTATEIHYGARGHGGQGSSCSRLINWVHNEGGMYLRKAYPEIGIDLSEYDGDFAHRLGRTGVSDAIRKVGAEHPVQGVTRVSDRDQLRGSLRAGFSVGGGGQHRFENKKDANGVSEWIGSRPWSHATLSMMCMDERPRTIKAYGDPLYLYIQSWGHKWNSGPRKIPGTNFYIPKGAFWIKESAAERMVSRGEYFVASNTKGFEPLRGRFGATGLI